MTFVAIDALRVNKIIHFSLQFSAVLTIFIVKI